MEKYSEIYTISCNQTDRFDKLSPSGVLDLFQDIAGRHAEGLGIGFDNLYKKGAIWIVARVKYDVLEYPEYQAHVKALTWEHEPSRIDYDRDYLLVNPKDNRVYIKGTSKWCIVDVSTRKILPTSFLPYQRDAIDDINYEDRFRPLPTYNLKENKYSFIVKTSQVDHNGHFNNSKYAEEVVNALKLSKEEVISSLEVNYIKECMLDDKLDVRYERVDKEIHIEIYNQDILSCRMKIVLK